MKKWARNVLRYGIVLGALAYLIGSGQLRPADLRLRAGALPYVAGAFALLAMGSLASYARYGIVARAVDVPLPLFGALRLGMIGGFFNTILLGGVGGDAVKLIYVMREAGTRAGALASVVVDRVIGLLGLLALGGGVLLLQLDRLTADPALINLSLVTFAVLSAALWCTLASCVALSRGRRSGALAWVGVGLLFCAAVASVYDRLGPDAQRHLIWIGAVDAVAALASFLAVPSCLPGGRLETYVRRAGTVGDKAMNIMRALLAARKSLPQLAFCFVVSIACHAMTVGSLYLLGQALALPRVPDLRVVFLAAPPALITNTLPIPGGGLGVGEAAFDHLVRLFSGEAVQGGAATFILFRLVMLAIGLLGLPFYLSDRRHIPAT
jgi:uncharacterized membrane protein YbhN (UPF0104 family)